MLIDYFTIVAQLVNFLILVWLLKRFLYKPILDAVSDRENRIAEQLTQAEATRSSAIKERDDFQKKNAAFDRKQKEMQLHLSDDLKSKRKELMEQARKEYDSFRDKLHESLRYEKETLNQEEVRKIQQEVYSIAGKALNDLASASLEEQIVRAFIQRLKAIDEKEKKSFLSAFQSSGQPVLVRTAFELSSSRRDEIEAAVKGLAGGNPSFLYENRPEQLAGIELSAGGYKIAWSIADYLSALQRSTTAERI